MIFDITNSKEYFQKERGYYNGLATNCVELLDDLLLLIEKTTVLKHLEYRYANLLVLLRFIDVEYRYLQNIASKFRDEGADIRPAEFLMHLKNYLVHIDSFIDYLDGFLEVMSSDAEFHYRFDRKAIAAFTLINETRNQIHHESLPTIDYNSYSIAPAHADFGGRQEVHEIRLHWPLSTRFTGSVDLSTMLRETNCAIREQFEGVIQSLQQEPRKRI